MHQRVLWTCKRKLFKVIKRNSYIGCTIFLTVFSSKLGIEKIQLNVKISMISDIKALKSDMSTNASTVVQSTDTCIQVLC